MYILHSGVEVEKLLEFSHRELMGLVHARARRRFKRGLNNNGRNFIKRLRRAKKAVAGTTKKPQPIKTHLRNMIILPEMVASHVGVYNGKGYIHVEVKV